MAPQYQNSNCFHWSTRKLCETDHHDPPQVEFTQLSGPLDHMKIDKMTLDDLSSDQGLLLEYVLGISKGEQSQPKICCLENWAIEPCKMVDFGN